MGDSFDYHIHIGIYHLDNVQMKAKRLGELIPAVLANREMTLAEKKAVDVECQQYDLDIMKALSTLIKMCNILPSPGTEQDPETRAKTYLDVLKNELSPNAITRVCEKALAGYIGDPKWLPMPGVLVRYAKENFIQVGPVKCDPRRASPPCSQLVAHSVEEPVMPERKREILDAIWPKKRPVLPVEVAVDIVGELAAKYRDKPLPKLSEEMRKLLGCGIPEISE